MPPGITGWQTNKGEEGVGQNLSIKRWNRMGIAWEV